jgi:hypothetical protein
MACCRCCEKTGACCNDGVCTQETCADCLDQGGVFQGVDTVCIGDGEDECPCDPPATPSQCEKCVDGVPTGYCSETDCCTDSVCRPCPEPTCPEETCTGTKCCVDGQCVTCPQPTCPTVACSDDLCCVDGFCVPCPDYDCDPECESGDCCVDGECVPCTACDPGDCPEGQCCVDGFCTDCPDPCSPGDCGPGFCCVDGFCLPCPPRECPDPPCPSGECCIDGYCINPCAEGECCVDGECEPTGACCASDGTCTQTCEGDCEGTWHDGVACEDIDCESGCCENVTSPNGGCSYSRCVRGETSGCTTPCDPDEEQNEEPVISCSGGTPTAVTVTGSGYLGNTGDPFLDADLEAIMNDSYSVDLSCNGSGELTLTAGVYFITINVGLAASRSANISLNDGLGTFAAMARQPAAEASVSNDCVANIYPCSVFSGAVTSSSGIGDFTGAQIDVA